MGKILAGTGVILFELPIYRVTKEKYNHELHKYVKKYKQFNPDPEIEIKLNVGLQKDFGGDWKYNEIIGYLEFYIIANDIRCAYYQGFNKIARKNGKRLFQIYDDTVTKSIIKNSYTNEKIIESINWMIEHCKSQDMFKKRYINTKIFDNMIQFIDWKEYIKKLKETTT